MAIFSTWFRQRPHVGVLGKGDRFALDTLLSEHRAIACFPIAWVEKYGVISPSRHSLYEFVGVTDGVNLLSAALIIGKGLVVLVGDDAAATLGAFCRDRLGALRTIVGTEAAVQAFQTAAEIAERRIELRQPQYCLEADGQSLAFETWDALTVATEHNAAFPHVVRLRAATREDTFPFLEATLRMYEEETGLTLGRGEIEAFQLSVKQKIREGRAWLIYDDSGQLIFKAGIGLPTSQQAHLEGVYVAPSYRRQGIGRLAMRRLCAELLCTYESISLTANQDNEAALSLYRGMGFRVASDFMTAYVRTS